jgi:hypothetical protein
MPVAERVAVSNARLQNEKQDLVAKLDQALTAENAPIRWQGPSLLNLGRLAVLQIFRGTQRGAK